MIYGEPNDAVFGDYPPGHPAGTDEFISVGEVTSGRGMGTGGVLGTQSRIAGEPVTPVDASPAVTTSTRPTVLIAVDGAALSERVVRTAHRLFGENASYLAINVSPGPYTQMSWAYVWPLAGPATWVPMAHVENNVDDNVVETAIDTGAALAAAVTREAGLAQATSLGDVGDPTTAIVLAAHHHNADVVVIGADARGWLSRVVNASVERELLREADFAVLVVSADQLSGVSAVR